MKNIAGWILQDDKENYSGNAGHKGRLLDKPSQGSETIEKLHTLFTEYKRNV